MLYLQLFIAACIGSLITWALCSWCSRAGGKMAAKLRQILNVGGGPGEEGGP